MTPVPVPLRIATSFVLLEVAALLATGVAVLVRLVGGGGTSLGAALSLVVFAVAVALVLVWAVRALRDRRRIGRGPLITWQLLQAATAVTVLQAATAGGWVLGAAWVALAAAVGVIVLVLVPAAVAHTAPS